MTGKQALFARLAEGEAARITVVTPNMRLARSLLSEFDAFQGKKNLSAWEAPDILPLDAFVQRAYEEALYSDAGASLPLLLTGAQEHALWKGVIAASRWQKELLALDETAAQCRKAWQLVHEWRLRGAPGNEDVEAFSSWRRRYEGLTSGDVDAARLPDLVAAQISHMRAPKALVAYAFDILPPQAAELFAALAAHGVEVSRCAPGARAGAAGRAPFGTAKEELERAAQWARARLEADPGARIGVVVPELGARRREVLRVFSRVMQPGGALPGAARAPLPFNVSLGRPLREVALVEAALSLLRLALRELAFDAASRLLRSPFLGGAEKERSLRARLDVELRKALEATVTLPRLIANARPAPLLRGALEKLFRLRDEGLFSHKTPAEWARHFSALLEAAGFPGERALDSEEFQALAKWHEALAELARLERVAKELAPAEALATLERLCRDTLWQAESADAPIQVLGVLESAGLEFDHLWVSGLTDERWPLPAAPHPFIPVALQVAAGIPESSAERSIELDRRITEGWRSAAGEVVFSFCTKEEDRELAPSPLIAALPEIAIDLPAARSFKELVFREKNLSTLDDRTAPPVPAGRVGGGTRVLSDQAACPFRAFARWRLAAAPLEAPAEGLDAAKRGSLAHALMKHLWSLLKDSSSLEKDPGPFVEQAAQAAVKELKLEGRFAALERARLARLAREWLEVEKARPPFEVVSMEEKRTLQIRNLEFSGRIDRMDRLEGGGYALIDYKTNRAPTPRQWAPPRPDDPQLPLYAVAAKEPIAAVAFAKFRPGEMRFMGFSASENLLPGVRRAKAWKPLLAEWKAEAEALGAGFAAGEARVDPKRELATCRYCALHTLCRVYEKVNVLSEGEEEEA